MSQRVLGLGDREILESAFSTSLTNRRLNGRLANSDGRIRVVEPFTQGAAKMLYDKLGTLWDERVTGTATSTFNKNQGAVLMSVSDGVAGSVLRQTYSRFNYEPNKTSVVSTSFVLGAQSDGVIQRFGILDNNNGLFIEQNGDGVFFVIRTSTSGSPDDSRRVNILDSNIRPDIAAQLNFEFVQNIQIFFNWHGTGSIAFAFEWDGAVTEVHEFRNDNRSEFVYMSTPQLPLRFQITNDGSGGAATMKQICTAYVNEGSVVDVGLSFAASRDGTPQTAPLANIWYPLLSLRIRAPDYIGRLILPRLTSVAVSTAGIFEVGVFRNPSVAGVDAAVWVQQGESGVEYDVSRDTTNVITGIIQEAVVFTGSQTQRGAIGLDNSELTSFGTNIDDEPEEMVIAVRRISGQNVDFYCTTNWVEAL